MALENIFTLRGEGSMIHGGKIVYKYFIVHSGRTATAQRSTKWVQRYNLPKKKTFRLNVR